jgi:hypothetical protein
MHLPPDLIWSLGEAMRKDFNRNLNDEELDQLGTALLNLIGPILVTRFEREGTERARTTEHFEHPDGLNCAEDDECDA